MARFSDTPVLKLDCRPWRCGTQPSVIECDDTRAGLNTIRVTGEYECHMCSLAYGRGGSIEVT